MRRGICLLEKETILSQESLDICYFTKFCWWWWWFSSKKGPDCADASPMNACVGLVKGWYKETQDLSPVMEP